MKQDVNFLLLSLLLLALMGMAGIALFAQGEYQKLGLQYAKDKKILEEKSRLLDNKTAEVELMRVELEAREKRLVDLVKELNLSKERQESLGGFFENLKGEKEELEENLTQTRSEKERWQNMYEAKRKDYEVCTVSLKFKEQQLTNSTATIAKLRNQFTLTKQAIDKSITAADKVNSGLSKVNTYLSEIEKKLSSIESTLKKYPDTGCYKSVSKLLDEADTKIGDTATYVDDTLKDEVSNMKNELVSASKTTAG